jgi:hypothetical protein
MMVPGGNHYMRILSIEFSIYKDGDYSDSQRIFHLTKP